MTTPDPISEKQREAMDQIDALLDERVPHPGVFLAAKLCEKRWSQEDLAMILDVALSTVGEIVRGKRGITYRMAAMLGQAFADVPATEWCRRWHAYQLDNLRPQKREHAA